MLLETLLLELLRVETEDAVTLPATQLEDGCAS